jgi:hypothetical protein
MLMRFSRSTGDTGINSAHLRSSDMKHQQENYLCPYFKSIENAIYKMKYLLLDTDTH